MPGAWAMIVCVWEGRKNPCRNRPDSLKMSHHPVRARNCVAVSMGTKVSPSCPPECSQSATESASVQWPFSIILRPILSLFQIIHFPQSIPVSSAGFMPNVKTSFLFPLNSLRFDSGLVTAKFIHQSQDPTNSDTIHYDATRQSEAWLGH